MSEHSAKRKTIAYPDETKLRGVRFETYCGCCGKQMSRFALVCKECGCKVLLNDDDKAATR